MDNIRDIYGHITDRIQKLTSALYRVTDLMSDKEPLKWTLRETSLAVHDLIVSIKLAKDKDRVLTETLNLSYRIIKTLELVSSGAGIASLNFEILKREYIYVKNFLEGKKTEFAYDPKMLPEFVLNQKKTREFSGRTPETPIAFPEQIIAGLKLPEGAPGAATAKAEEQDVEPQSRKGKILNFLKDGEARSVGEVAAIFNGGASDKAVQRDLFDLVRMGKVEAKGDKRWRKYEILKNG
ncbi:MAG: hypothetical protein L6Q29_01495 [Candidatus Pacebacteria bacterium]|nr:hypothetical protein [Candidatus Paceibacterota bacterium]NUQ57218.1 hypothetical protein [Candidatus Paceibacter sp.]